MNEITLKEEEGLTLQNVSVVISSRWKFDLYQLLGSKF